MTKIIKIKDWLIQRDLANWMSLVSFPKIRKLSQNIISSNPKSNRKISDDLTMTFVVDKWKENENSKD